MTIDSSKSFSAPETRGRTNQGLVSLKQAKGSGHVEPREKLELKAGQFAVFSTGSSSPKFKTMG